MKDGPTLSLGGSPVHVGRRRGPRRRCEPVGLRSGDHRATRRNESRSGSRSRNSGRRPEGSGSALVRHLRVLRLLPVGRLAGLLRSVAVRGGLVSVRRRVGILVCIVGLVFRPLDRLQDVAVLELFDRRRLRRRRRRSSGPRSLLPLHSKFVELQIDEKIGLY